MACYIFGAGSYYGLRSKPDVSDYVIAADGGWRWCRSAGLTPDLLLGDFDSLGEVPAFDHILRVPVEKDDTDMMLAVKKALAMGARDVLLLGGLGGRLDHTYANIQTLAYLLEHRASGTLADENHLVSMVDQGSAVLSLEYRYLSVFAYSGVCEGVTITGAEYPLENAVLEPSFPLGVSNRHAPGQQMKVSVEKGTLLLIQSKLA